MKTMKYISLRVLAIAALALAFAMPAKAQLSDNGYANVDWQFNAPLKNHFADKASGWGKIGRASWRERVEISVGAG